MPEKRMKCGVKEGGVATALKIRKGLTRTTDEYSATQMCVATALKIRKGLTRVELPDRVMDRLAVATALKIRKGLTPVSIRHRLRL